MFNVDTSTHTNNRQDITDLEHHLPPKYLIAFSILVWKKFKIFNH